MVRRLVAGGGGRRQFDHGQLDNNGRLIVHRSEHTDRVTIRPVQNRYTELYRTCTLYHKYIHLQSITSIFIARQIGGDFTLKYSQV